MHLRKGEKKIRLHIVEQAAEQGLNLVYKCQYYFSGLLIISFGGYFVQTAHGSLLSLVLGFGRDPLWLCNSNVGSLNLSWDRVVEIEP